MALELETQFHDQSCPGDVDHVEDEVVPADPRVGADAEGEGDGGRRARGDVAEAPRDRGDRCLRGFFTSPAIAYSHIYFTTADSGSDVHSCMLPS